jgi:hypothetical protein
MLAIDRCSSCNMKAVREQLHGYVVGMLAGKASDYPEILA